VVGVSGIFPVDGDCKLGPEKNTLKIEITFKIEIILKIEFFLLQVCFSKN
jgi:hypothetical protein